MNHPAYEDLEAAGVWAPSAAGQGIEPRLGQRPVAAPRGAQHTEGWGAQVQLDGGGGAAGGPRTGTPQDIAAAMQAESATAAAAAGAGGGVEHGTAANAAAIPPPAAPGPEKAAVVRVSSEIAAAAAAALNVPADTAMRTEYIENRIQKAWRQWLLQALAARGYKFPAADQPPLTAEGYVDMERESELETGTSAEADALHEVTAPFPSAIPSAYVALVDQADRDRTFLYPWPQSLEGAYCQYDHHPFSGPPVSIPEYQDVHGVYIMRGVFCSPACAIAHINRSGQAEAQKAAQRANLAAFVHAVVGDSFMQAAPALLKEAGPLETLKRYGGQYTIAQWRALNPMLSTHHFTAVPPYMPGFVLHAVQTRDAAFLQGLRTADTIQPPSSVITIPATDVPKEVIKEHMERVAEEQQHETALYARWLRTEEEREGRAAEQGFSDAGLHATSSADV